MEKILWPRCEKVPPGTQVSGGEVVGERVPGPLVSPVALTQVFQLESSLIALIPRPEVALPQEPNHSFPFCIPELGHVLVTESLTTGGGSPIWLLSNINQAYSRMKIKCCPCSQRPCLLDSEHFGAEGKEKKDL